MELLHYLVEHGFSAFGTGALALSLFITAFELHHVQKAQRIRNLFAITSQHRDIWSNLLERPELRRVLDPKADAERHPPTTAELLFVTFLIHHFVACQEAAKARVLTPVGDLGADVRKFFSLPVPNRVWRIRRNLLDPDFVAYVENHLKTPQT